MFNVHTRWQVDDRTVKALLKTASQQSRSNRKTIKDSYSGEEASDQHVWPLRHITEATAKAGAGSSLGGKSPLDSTRNICLLFATSLKEGRQPVTPFDGAWCGACGCGFVSHALGLHGGSARRH
jgi:hypothetical protein